MKMESIEKIWAAVIAFGPAKAVSAKTSIIKYDETHIDRLKIARGNGASATSYGRLHENLRDERTAFCLSACVGYFALLTS